MGERDSPGNIEDLEKLVSGRAGDVGRRYGL